MKEFVFQNKFFCLTSIFAVASFGYSLSQYGAIAKAEVNLAEANKHMQILRDKDKLLEEGYDDLMTAQLKNTQDQQIELARGQGRIEGMLSIINNFKPESNETSAIWHAGYYRGLQQAEEMKASKKPDTEISQADPDKSDLKTNK